MLGLGLTAIIVLLALILLALIAGQISVQGERSWIAMLIIIVVVIAWMFWPK